MAQSKAENYALLFLFKEDYKLKEFEVTIKATAFKKAKVFAETEEAAINLANEIYCKTNLLDFKDEDVDEISVGADEISVEESAEQMRNMMAGFFENNCDIDEFIFRQGLS